MRRLGIDEAKSARIGGHASDDEVHPVGQAEPLAANLNELAGRDQGAQAPLERRPLLARDFQELEQLLDGGGMVDPLFVSTGSNRSSL